MVGVRLGDDCGVAGDAAVGAVPAPAATVAARARGPRPSGRGSGAVAAATAAGGWPARGAGA